MQRADLSLFELPEKISQAFFRLFESSEKFFRHRTRVLSRMNCSFLPYKLQIVRVIFFHSSRIYLSIVEILSQNRAITTGQPKAFKQKKRGYPLDALPLFLLYKEKFIECLSRAISTASSKQTSTCRPMSLELSNPIPCWLSQD